MQDFKRELIKYGRKIFAGKFVIGSGGNISVRSGNKVYIKASGVSLENSCSADYNEVNLKTGKAICFNGPCSVEIPMHLACYRARPEIVAVVHTHPVYGIILGMAGIKLGYISYEFMFTMKSEVPTRNYKSAGSAALAGAVGRTIKKNNGALLKNHGIIVVGVSLAEAYEWSVGFVRAAKICIFSGLLGGLSLIPKKELKRLSGISASSSIRP